MHAAITQPAINGKAARSHAEAQCHKGSEPFQIFRLLCAIRVVHKATTALMSSQYHAFRAQHTPIPIPAEPVQWIPLGHLGPRRHALFIHSTNPHLIIDYPSLFFLMEQRKGDEWDRGILSFGAWLEHFRKLSFRPTKANFRRSKRFETFVVFLFHSSMRQSILWHPESRALSIFRPSEILSKAFLGR